MWVRCVSTVRSPRTRAAATSRFVRPSATSSATRCSAGGAPPRGCGRRSDRARRAHSPPSRLRPSPRMPRPPPQSRHAPHASAGASPDEAEGEQRACPSEWIPRPRRTFRPRARGASVPRQRRREPPPQAPDPAPRVPTPTLGRHGLRLPPSVQQLRRFIDSTDFHERFGVLAKGRTSSDRGSHRHARRPRRNARALQPSPRPKT